MTSNASTRKRKELLSRILVLNKQRRYKIDSKSAAFFCSAVLQAIGAPDRSLSVAFVSEYEIKKLNNSYLQRNYPTDVLCFVYNEDMEDGKPFLGEIIIAPHVSVRNAEQYRNHPENEMRKLLIHGILHLLGYDHEEDDGTMLRLQKKLTRRIFFKSGDPVLIKSKAYP
ncbi:MAG: rRNA maturation RNase YbeY [Acidobacteria bacterium]|nr:rRNA maturation RNase YbeY [Acidobacteriota bacterium]